ncbi:unnamed protein product [Aphanomyces euteiches]|uniref:Uncharacterized protein n=1 Tax=Aphanomyces euteiches TaxID=100861 RepID=A0A6G0WEV4_9STRA|nr:hypothetical protein Ae201684_015698 [Aphanomyces euteiches]KAH9093967.1 hypothetical protein Ae201684P_016586 [Aphanomyces euteiches]KAH9134779.1 hypothetical protein AeRB84_019548 [Aphanomyces euteiches]
MRDTLTNQLGVWSGMWSFIETKLANPLPIQMVIAMSFLVCLGFHYNLVLPFQIKDDVCAKIMINDPLGRLSASSTYLKYSHFTWYFFAMSFGPFLFTTMTDLVPEVCCIVSAIGFVLDAIYQDLKEHMEDYEERMNELLDAKE